MTKIKLLCLFGGVSEEHDVSVVSAASVLSHISDEKYELTVVGITKEGKWLLYEGDHKKLSADWQKDAAKEVAEHTGLSKNELYQAVIAAQSDEQ